MARAKRSEAADADSSAQAGVDSAAAARTAKAESAQAAPEAALESQIESVAAAPADAIEPLPGPEAEPGPGIEPQIEPQIEPEAATVAGNPPAAASAPPRRRSGGFLMPALGGVVAAGLGFGAAVYVLPTVWAPPQTRSDLAELTDALTAQTLRLDELQATVATLRGNAASAGDLAALSEAHTAVAGTLKAARADLDSLESRLTSAAEAFGTLDARLTALEKRPVDGGGASATALDAFGRDMAEVRAEIAAERAAVSAAQDRIAAATEAAESRIAAVEAEAVRLKAEAAAETARGTALASLRHVQAALESGAPMADALAGLAAAGVSIPPALTDQAQGVPSLAALHDAYPPAARIALAAALRAQSDEAGLWTRFGAFLRSQSGARSLAPRAGDDPDAILSRAEAALRFGDLPATIAGIAELPPEGQAPMAEWITLANRRIAATDAVAALVRDINQGATE